jgi:hypothetical protein
MSELNYIDLVSLTALGDRDRAIINNMHGFDHRQTGTQAPSNRDNYGYTFFVRPQLNMQRNNLLNTRQTSILLNTNYNSIAQFVRCTLDPRIINGYRLGNNYVPGIQTPLVDNKQAFIPILTNNLISMSGWHDLVVPTYTTSQGMYREQYAQADGIYKHYGEFELSATFRNTRGSPIPALFYYWEFYMCSVFEGKLSPYLDMIASNRIDYNTRIYRLVMSEDKRVVTDIASTGVSFPVTNPMGSIFDFNSERPYNEQNKEFTIRFKSLGSVYRDPITIREFNATVGMFNPDMKGKPSSAMVKIPHSVANMFNHAGYPRIDPDTHELEWWVDKKRYEDVSRVIDLAVKKRRDPNLSN